MPELRKFNIRISKDQKLSIINDGNHEILHDILMKLRDFDMNVQAGENYNNDDQDLQRSRKKLLRAEDEHYILKTEEKDTKSELNLKHNTPIERAIRNREDAESNMNILLNESTHDEIL